MRTQDWRAVAASAPISIVPDGWHFGSGLTPDVAAREPDAAVLMPHMRPHAAAQRAARSFSAEVAAQIALSMALAMRFMA